MVDQSIADELVALTSELITFRSTSSRPEETRRCANFIEQWFLRFELPYSRSLNEEVDIFTALPADNPCPLLLMSHFDVVEGSDKQFVPRMEDGRLFGRGAIDDKYAVATSMILYREHISQQRRAGGQFTSFPFGLLITGDEEAGGHRGAGSVAKHLRPDYFLALDGGQPQRIVVKEKGIIALTLTAKGKAAHGARPWLGENGFDILLRDYQKMKALFSHDTPDHWHPTLVLSNCQAGSGATNVVPDRARATFDIRYTENEDPNVLLASIEEVVESDIEVSYIEPVFDGGTSPTTDLLAKLSGGTLVAEHGASDARFFSQQNIAGAVWGADGEMSQHSDNEYLVVDSMFAVYATLAKLVNAITF